MAGTKRTKRLRKKGMKKNKSIKKVITRALVARGLNKPELRYHYTNVLTNAQVTSTIYSTGTFLQPLSQGDAADNMATGSQVTGLKYNAKYIDLYGHFFNTSTTSNHSVRVILIRDDQPYAGNSIVPWSGTANYNECLFQFQYMYSEFHSYKPRRFKVLMDQTIVLGAASQDRAQKVLRRHINLRNTLVSNTLNVGSTFAFYPQNHQYLLYIISDSDAENPVYSTFKAKFAYTDV